MTKTDLLAITQPESLFPGSLDEAKAIYRKLSLAWHPDRPSGSAEVFAHITTLYREAEDRIKQGRWAGPASLQLTAVSGEVLGYATRTSHTFPYGQALVCDEALVYLFDPGHEAIVERTVRTDYISYFKFASGEMAKEFVRYLPHLHRMVPLQDGRTLIHIGKTPDLIRLRDLVTHLGPIDPRHTAWMVSRLLNLACYLTFTGIVHHDISQDTVYVSPEHHSVALLGGWWSAVARGTTVTTVPKRTFSVMPFAAKTLRRASTLTDLELIRLTAREISQPMPNPMGAWLIDVAKSRPYDQIAEWKTVLEQTFGQRKFVPLPVTADAVYSTAGRKVV